MNKHKAIMELQDKAKMHESVLMALGILEQWEFCKSDPEDEREIHYEMMTGDVSEKLEFTSQEIVSMKVMDQIRKSIIRDIKLTDNWWHVSLEYKEEADMQKITMSKMERLEAEKEEFKQMYAECFPHLAIVADVLKKFGDERGIQTDGASIYITPDGYISMGNLSEGYTACEVGYPSQKEELLMPYIEDPVEPTKAVYPYVPIKVIEQVIEKHGGWFDTRIPFA